jgi:hypothetical protein
MNITSIDYLMPVCVNYQQDDGTFQEMMVFINYNHEKVFSNDGFRITGEIADQLLADIRKQQQMHFEFPDGVLQQMKKEKSTLLGGVQDVRGF